MSEMWHTGPFTEADFLAGSLVRFSDASATIDVVTAPHLLRYRFPGGSKPRECLGRIDSGAHIVHGVAEITAGVVAFRAADPAVGLFGVHNSDIVWLGDRSPVLAEGRINGAPVGHEDRWMVPVWCDRDHGREPTTVYVDSANLVAVQFPATPAKVRGLPPAMRAAVSAAEESLAQSIGPKPFTGAELDQIAEAVASVLYTQHAVTALDPLKAESVRVLTEQGRHGVTVHLVDGRTFRLTLGHFTAPDPT